MSQIRIIYLMLAAPAILFAMEDDLSIAQRHLGRK